MAGRSTVGRRWMSAGSQQQSRSFHSLLSVNCRWRFAVETSFLPPPSTETVRRQRAARGECAPARGPPSASQHAGPARPAWVVCRSPSPIELLDAGSILLCRARSLARAVLRPVASAHVPFRCLVESHTASRLSASHTHRPPTTRPLPRRIPALTPYSLRCSQPASITHHLNRPVTIHCSLPLRSFLFNNNHFPKDSLTKMTRQLYIGWPQNVLCSNYYCSKVKQPISVPFPSFQLKYIRLITA